MHKKRILSNGVEMPSIGMGTYPLQNEAMTAAAVDATSCGYRAFDTAHAYDNEASLGVALKEVYRVNRLRREDIFITSKTGDDLDQGIPDGKLFYAAARNEQKDIRGIVLSG